MASELLVFNFVMDRSDPLLSHQYEAVSELAKNFDAVTVVTGKIGDVGSNPKVRIVSTAWNPGHKIGNVARLLLVSIPLIMRGNYKSVFYHMTDVQCAILSPLVRLRGKKQYLWYAHAHKSKFLAFSSWWITSQLTSTIGSTPIIGNKVKAIGQAIDVANFSPLRFELLNSSKLVHIGRFDKSKNIQALIESARILRKTYPHLTLSLVGSPANVESRVWAQNLVKQSEPDVQEGWLSFKESIPREDFPREIALNGCFIHSYIGSLDKTLVESTMLRVPVITLNTEYAEIFGTWARQENIDLVTEYIALRSMTQFEIEKELDRRLEIAVKSHSLEHWIRELTQLLE